MTRFPTKAKEFVNPTASTATRAILTHERVPFPKSAHDGQNDYANDIVDDRCPENDPAFDLLDQGHVFRDPGGDPHGSGEEGGPDEQRFKGWVIKADDQAKRSTNGRMMPSNPNLEAIPPTVRISLGFVSSPTVHSRRITPIPGMPS
jgi:hypothetical protein